MELEEAITADRETALSVGIKQDMRLMKARQATAHVLHFLQPYIRKEAFEEAYGVFLKATYEAEVEVVSRAQIKELERYRDAILDKAKMERILAPIIIPALPPSE